MNATKLARPAPGPQTAPRPARGGDRAARRTAGLANRIRRAPARIIASVLAIALAVGAVGVFGTTDIAGDSLQTQADHDQLGHLLVNIAPTDPAVLAGAIAELDGVESVTGSVVGTVEVTDGMRHTMIGMTPGRTVDLVTPVEGRLPTAPGETIVSPGVAAVGDRIVVAGGPATAAPAATSFVVVGLGTTTAWAERSVLYVAADDARAVTGVDGVNHLSLRVADPTQAHLDDTAALAREALETSGSTFRSFPWTLPGGVHPIEDDLAMVSTMIGLLGVVAGAVALILLTSTTNALIVEQTREVAVMRALGGRRRPLRRRLRRQALTIAAVGAVLGVPLGVVIANVIARLVLERFAGVTPEIGVSVPVAVASVAFALLGARLVAIRAARRATGVPLVDALRDAEGTPYGQRWLDRAVTRMRTGGPIGRLAARTHVRHRGRSLALGAQIAAALGAAITVASLFSSVSDLADRELEGWNWQTQIRPVDLSYPFPEVDPARDATLELGVYTWGTLDGWDVDITGLDVDTAILDTGVSDGRWLTASPREAVVAASFAHRTGIELGDSITVQLATGPSDYRVTGFHPVFGREVVVNRADLAADLGVSGAGNRLWAVDPPAGAATGKPQLGTATSVPLTATTIEELRADDIAARRVILALFSAVGAIVMAVATLSVASTMAVQLYERRHEIAAMQAIGSTRAVLRRLVTLELVPLTATGLVVGTVAGWLGARAVIESFAEANAVDLATTLAWWTVPAAAAGALLLAVVIGAIVIRSVAGRSPAVVLRGASC